MSDNTKIEWADATVNAVNGCSLASPGCTNCYAMKQAHRFPVRQGLTTKTKGGMVWTGEVRLSETALLQPLKWKRARRIFWNAHGDLFHENVPDEWIDRVFAVCALTPQHTHMILTKRSARMREYVVAHRWQNILDEQYELQAGGLSSATPVAEAWPLPNVWLGVSVEDQTRADERIPDLLATPAAVRFISAEPLLGPVDLRQFMWPVCKSMPGHYSSWAEAEAAGELTYKRQSLVSASATFIDWVIVGGESGPGARPMHPDWARSLRDQCAAAGVPLHFKQWGEWLPGQNEVYPNWGGRSVAHHQDGSWGVIEKRGSGKNYVTWDEEGTFRQGWCTDHPGHFNVLHWATRVGKKQAGRLLDGMTHDGLPA